MYTIVFSYTPSKLFDPGTYVTNGVKKWREIEDEFRKASIFDEFRTDDSILNFTKNISMFCISPSVIALERGLF